MALTCMHPQQRINMMAAEARLLLMSTLRMARFATHPGWSSHRSTHLGLYVGSKAHGGQGSYMHVLALALCSRQGQVPPVA